jgi:hypothetical protein
LSFFVPFLFAHPFTLPLASSCSGRHTQTELESFLSTLGGLSSSVLKQLDAAIEQQQGGSSGSGSGSGSGGGGGTVSSEFVSKLLSQHNQEGLDWLLACLCLCFFCVAFSHLIPSPDVFAFLCSALLLFFSLFSFSFRAFPLFYDVSCLFISFYKQSKQQHIPFLFFSKHCRSS